MTARGGRDGLAELADLEAVFAALAHASRRHVLVVIHARGSMTAGEIADRFHHAWPTTSRHLKVLEQAGLLRAERRGRERVYTVDVRRLRSVVGDWLRWFGRGPPAG